jgi:AcrR family transcriptional regulator
MTEAPTPVRPPKQKRSRDSLERVLEAATALLEENGFEAFTIQDVSGRADVSVGAIYARFGSKENLLRAVHRRAMEALGAEQDVAASLDGQAVATARDAIVAAVNQVAGVFRGHDKLLRAFMHIGAIDDEIARRGSQGSIELSRSFKEAVLAYRDEIAHSDPELAADVAFRMAYSTFARQVMYGPVFESDRPVEWDELVREVASACAAYLLGANGPAAAKKPRARSSRKR